MKILLAGDFHGNASHANLVFAHAKKLDCQEIYQLGDFGYGWEMITLKGGHTACKFSTTIAKFVKKYNIPLSFLDGNHENFDRLLALPLDKDGKRTVAPGVKHLPRGLRFFLDGRTFLTIGGAVSVDRAYRVEGKSWWAKEPITPTT